MFWSKTSFVLIAGVALAATVMAGFAGTDVYIPSVGQGPGAYGSQWMTTMWINNPGAANASCQISLLRRNQENSSPPVYNMTIAPGETVRIEEALPTLFGETGYGALRVVSSSEVVVNSRIFNIPGTDPSDTQGQFFCAMPASFSVGLGESTDVLGVNQAPDGNFRYNFGFVETSGHSVTVEVVLYDEDATVLGLATYTLRPREAKQISLANFGAGATPTANGRLHFNVTSGSGRILAFGSSVANTSQDPSTFEMTMTADASGSGDGDITAVWAQNGLEGGGASGEVTLGIANGGVTTARISASGSSSGQVLTSNGSTVSWQDPPTGGGGGDISAVHAGAGLTGGGDTGDVTLALADSGVTTAKLADAAVTAAKVSSSGGSNGQVLKISGGNVAWAADDAGGLTLPYSGSASSSDPAFAINQSGDGSAIRAYNSGGGYAVRAWSNGTGPTLRSTSDNGEAASFYVSAHVGTNPGVSATTYHYGPAGRFYSATTESGVMTSGVVGRIDTSVEGSAGVRGQATATAGLVYGVLGKNNSPAGAGVRGEGNYTGVQGASTRTSGIAYGLWGWNGSTEGAGVYGYGQNLHGVQGITLGDWNWASGVYGQATQDHANGVTGWNSAGGPGVYAWSEAGTAIIGKSGSGNLIELFDSDPSENRRFVVTNNGTVYADGSYTGPAGDFAEKVPSRDSALEPGDVVVVAADGRFMRSTVAHQSSVVGVYSTRPLTVGDVYAKAAQDDKVPVAVIGIVPVKVCDQGGAILPGDLLSASDIPGTAMKTSRPGPGTVIGKALEAHEAGEGSILMLVSLR